MLAGIGVDITDTRRIEAALSRLGDRFVQRILTAQEQAAFSHKKRCAAWLAKRFAAKEAMVKALGTGIGAISFQDIIISNNAQGAPKITLSTNAQTLCTHKNLNLKSIHLSLSDEKNYAIAFVVLEK